MTGLLELADQAGEALNEIVGSIDQVREMADEIAVTSEEQSDTSEEIAQSVQSISASVQEAAGAVTQVADSASELNEVTEELHASVNRFTLREGQAGSADETSAPTEKAFGPDQDGERAPLEGGRRHERNGRGSGSE